MEELRVLTDTTKDYKAFTDFDKWVLKKATYRNYRKHPIQRDLREGKKGRSIADIIFHIDKKPTKSANKTLLILNTRKPKNKASKTYLLKLCKANIQRF